MPLAVKASSYLRNIVSRLNVSSTITQRRSDLDEHGLCCWIKWLIHNWVILVFFHAQKSLFNHWPLTDRSNRPAGFFFSSMIYPCVTLTKRTGSVWQLAKYVRTSNATTTYWNLAADRMRQLPPKQSGINDRYELVAQMSNTNMKKKTTQSMSVDWAEFVIF